MRYGSETATAAAVPMIFLRRYIVMLRYFA